jgi:hypothetical protein
MIVLPSLIGIIKMFVFTLDALIRYGLHWIFDDKFCMAAGADEGIDGVVCGEFFVKELGLLVKRGCELPGDC